MTESSTRVTKTPAAYLREGLSTQNQRDFAAFVTHHAKIAGVWPKAKAEQDAFLAGVNGAGLYARYQKAKGTPELAAILSPKAPRGPRKATAPKPGPVAANSTAAAAS